MKSIIVLFTFIFTILLFGPSRAHADVKNCRPVFGGGETCTEANNIEIDKFIKNPANNNYVDNLDPSTMSVTPDQSLTFRLTIKNKKDTRLNNIKITDTLPSSLEFVSASDNAKYDKNKHTVNYEVDLESGKSLNLSLITKVSSNATTGCVTNQALADVEWKKALDNSQFCIAGTNSFPTTKDQTTQSRQPQVAPQTASTTQEDNLQPQPGSLTKGGKTLYPTPNVTNNPNTGPEAIAFIALIPTAAIGLFIKRRSKPLFHNS